jgi:hypothetical protein
MPTNIKYLCIDDQQDSTIDPLLSRLENDGLISFDRWTPKSLEGQLPAIQQFVAQQSGPFGLLLDLRLDVDADADGNRVSYRGPTLAQELRTRMAEGTITPFPIALWSVNTKFQQSYFGDESSHDLFDDIFGKDREVADQPKVVAEKLASLAYGYHKLRSVTKTNLVSTLGLSEEVNSPLYSQFLDEYSQISIESTTHELAHFLLNDLIRVEGLLVTESMIAARLGVNITNSKDSWETIKEKLQVAKYTGPFCEAWPRFWWFRVEDWWATLESNISELGLLDSHERVTKLNEIFSTKLVASEPILPKYSACFSTLCVGTSLPLDPIDGLRVVRRSSRTWQDTLYVSAHAALERINKDCWRLDPLERDRLAWIKEEGA